MNLSEIQLEDLDIEDLKKIGSAPTAVKAVIIVLLCILVAVAGYFLDITDQINKLKSVTAQEQVLRNKFMGKQAKAANLDAYKQQLKEMRTSFGVLLRQLPNQTEIETLLTDISQTGISSGLDIDYFKPVGLRPKEFYSEYPIKLKVTGHFHQFGQFISGVAALPRIVTIQDISIKPAQPKKDTGNTGGGKLTMEVTAVTYQYLDEKAQGAKK